MKTISKEHIALIQLRTAVRLFYEGEFISAITLSGAAEEILGKLSKAETGSNAMEQESFMFRVILPKYNYQADRNYLRNELKHKDTQLNEVAYDNFKETAVTHISGAITNYKLLHGQLPDETQILEFCKSIGLS